MQSIVQRPATRTQPDSDHINVHRQTPRLMTANELRQWCTDARWLETLADAELDEYLANITENSRLNAQALIAAVDVDLRWRDRKGIVRPGDNPRWTEAFQRGLKARVSIESQVSQTMALRVLIDAHKVTEDSHLDNEYGSDQLTAWHVAFGRLLWSELRIREHGGDQPSGIYQLLAIANRLDNAVLSSVLAYLIELRNTFQVDTLTGFAQALGLEISAIIVTSGLQDSFRSVERGHSHIEVRECWTMHEPDYLQWLNETEAWTYLGSIVMVAVERRIGEQVSQETRYYLSSLSSSAKNVPEAVRAYAGVPGR